ncbi:hypothetical protein LHJ74_22900 [Streptomyces sp. N2-109]|uniref:Uncharacterized protein n=1 Tax=Streptomyces gossypii TaxID=2883101 RepID=A0ABT2JY12_9ACTN|nr:hypothetical protein [Streptomyces gossypii]MCT2592726.1 hypothetical protein [Streptomyces gossypii]
MTEGYAIRQLEHQIAQALHRITAVGAPGRLRSPESEPLLDAIREELNARDLRAYTSGWQDAVEAAHQAEPASSSAPRPSRLRTARDR